MLDGGLGRWQPTPMKLFPVLSASVVLGLAACNTTNGPLSNTGFDPLLPPGAGSRLQNSGPAFKAGDMARAIMDNTYFYHQLPKANAEADKTLLRGTGMKVAEVASSYLKVELDVTGEVGYVPAVMLENISTQAPSGQAPAYPPLPSGEILNPAGPPVEPPGGVIPPIQDPGLPGTPLPGIGSSPPPLPTAPGVPPTLDPVSPVEPKLAPPGQVPPAAPGITPPTP